MRAGADSVLAQRVVEFAPRGSKEERANQAAVWCKRGMVLLALPGPVSRWLIDFERELFNFPDSQFKDQVDAFCQIIIYVENYLISGWHGILAKGPQKFRDSRVARALRKG